MSETEDPRVALRRLLWTMPVDEGVLRKIRGMWECFEMSSTAFDAVANLREIAEWADRARPSKYLRVMELCHEIAKEKMPVMSELWVKFIDDSFAIKKMLTVDSNG